MAKKSIQEREKKRQTLVFRFSKTRKNLIKKLKIQMKFEDFFAISEQIQKLPINSSKVRLRNRCWKTAKPRGYSKFFGLCRNALREFSHNCLLPGVTTASW
jgi:small subunit ribosomal protein S14